MQIVKLSATDERAMDASDGTASSTQAAVENGEILGLRDLTFTFDAELSPVLSHVNFSICKGERVLVLGPSGGGKSTLLMVLAGLIPRIIDGVLEGEVRLDGSDRQATPTSLASFSSKVAIIMQDPESQITCLTVEDEVAFALENFNMERGEILDRVDRTLSQTKMDAIRQHLVYTLSGGQKQRLSIACALARQPEVIILDEPLSNLDPIGCTEVMPLIVALSERDATTLVMTAHDFSSFAHHFDRVLIIADGKLVKDAPIRQALSDVPLLRSLGLEIPGYIDWAFERLKGVMPAAPLTSEEAVQMVAHAGKLPLSDGLPAQPKSAAAETNAEPVIAVTSLSVAFGGKTVLSDISFSVRRGEIVALVGYNGSGKSTLALTLAGVIPPRSGDVTILGETYRFRRGRKIGKGQSRIGYVFQYPEHQFLYDTVLEEMMHGQDALQAEAVKDILAEIGIVNMAGHPYELSGGQKRRLGVKSTVVHDPQILILDEPTYGQDQRNRQLIEDDIQALNAKGTTIFVITHDMDFILEIATRVLVLRHGALVYDGPPGALFEEGFDLAALGLVPPVSQRLAEAIRRKIGERRS